MTLRFLIIDEIHSCFIPALEKIDCEADYQPTIGYSEILEIISEYDGLVLRSKRVVNSELVNQAPNLKIIARVGSGTEHIDEKLLKEKGMQLLTSPEGNRDAVAEHAVGLLLCLFNKIHSADRTVRKGIWDREGNRGTEIGGKTVAVIGYGNTGKAFAERLKSFGCRIIAYDKYLKDFADDSTEEVTLQTIFEEADVLSLHIPLTSETHYLVNEAFLNQFKKNIWLINTSRGEIIDTQALVNGIQSEKIHGAGLDVIEYESHKKLADADLKTYDFLKECENVVMTPHTAGWSDESEKRMAEVLVDKINSTIKQLKL